MKFNFVFNILYYSLYCLCYNILLFYKIFIILIYLYFSYIIICILLHHSKY